MFQHVFQVPATVPLKDRRYFSLANAIGIGGFLGHAMLMASFLYFGIAPMAWFNVGSLLLFAAVFVINRFGYSIAGIYMGTVEVMLHAIAAVILIGWESGFYFYLFLIFIFIFLGKREYDRIGIAISLINMMAFGGLLAYTDWGHDSTMAIDKGTIHFYSITNLLTVSLLMGFGIYYYKDTANKVEDELEKAHKRTQDSIRYAYRIQKVLLPSESYASPYVKDHFILFKSRDIVSGDFYWMHFFPEEQRLLVSAVDCTGHGVPGAFMTMMAAVLLEGTVIEQGIWEPHLVLSHLHQSVASLLKQEQSDRQEGMDMAICCLDFKEDKLLYAGAKMPLLYVEGQTLKEIKGTKRSVGGIRSKRNIDYDLHTMPLSSISGIYLFSDGYTDQFGGEQQQKFSNKRLKALLNDIKHLPMPAQKQVLEKKLSEWMGTDTRQIDDIMAIGLSL